MPFVKGKSLTDVNRKLEKKFKQIDEQLIPRGLYAAISVGAAYASAMTPIDTSNLINSQFIDVKPYQGGYRGIVGYSANYALFVHEAPGKLKGLPRPDGKSVFWAPDGEPKFLQKGFEQHMAEINDVFYKAIKI